MGTTRLVNAGTELSLLASDTRIPWSSDFKLRRNDNGEQAEFLDLYGQQTAYYGYCFDDRSFGEFDTTCNTVAICAPV